MLRTFSKKHTLKQIDAYGCYGAIFAFREFKFYEAITSTSCVETKKEALARRILQVRQLLTPLGTCLIDNATLLNTMCDALLPQLAMKQVIVEEPNRLNTEL